MLRLWVVELGQAIRVMRKHRRELVENSIAARMLMLDARGRCSAPVVGTGVPSPRQAGRKVGSGSSTSKFVVRPLGRYQLWHSACRQSSTAAVVGCNVSQRYLSRPLSGVPGSLRCCMEKNEVQRGMWSRDGTPVTQKSATSLEGRTTEKGFPLPPRPSPPSAAPGETTFPNVSDPARNGCKRLAPPDELVIKRSGC